MCYGRVVTEVATGNAAAPGRRERKRSQTRADLIAAAHHLFSEQGFDETTTADIAERADVSQRTLFRHFPSKEAVLYGDMEGLRHELRDALAERPSGESIVESLRQAMLSLANDVEQNRGSRLLQGRLAAGYPSVSAYSRAVVQTEWERELIEAVALRLGVDAASDARPEVLAGATMSAIRFATRQWTTGGAKGDYLLLILDAMGCIDDLGMTT